MTNTIARAILLALLAVWIYIAAMPYAKAAEVCTGTPERFTEDLLSIAKEGKFESEVKVYRFEGEQVVAIREYVEKELLPEGATMLDFDTIVVVSREGFPVVANAIFLDGCNVGAGSLPVEILTKFIEIASGV